MDFISKFLEHTKECESPTSFFQWSAISMLSATMRDNIYLQWGKHKIYPNLYVMLLADSGACRKGFPINLAIKFLSQINNTKLILGRSSIQGVIQELAAIETNSNRIMQKKGACGIQLAEEYAASFVNDPAVVQILTDIYDYKEKYPVRLRDSVTELNNVCFSFFVATNTTMLQQMYDTGAIEGGLVGRIFIIHEKKRRLKNSLVRQRTQPKDFSEELLTHLKSLAKIKGEAVYDDAAIECYDNWYNSFNDDEDAVEDKTGFIWRVHTGVAKLSLCLAAAEEEIKSGIIVVKEKHVEQAIELAFKVKQNQQQLTMGQGKNPAAAQMAIFIKALDAAKFHQLTRRQLLSKHWQDFDTLTLDKIIHDFEGAGLLRTTAILNEVGYQLTERALEKVLGHKKLNENTG